MYFDGLYLKNFSPLTLEFCVRYLDFPKIAVEQVIYQDWDSLLWHLYGYLDVSEFFTVGFLLP